MSTNHHTQTDESTTTSTDLDMDVISQLAREARGEDVSGLVVPDPPCDSLFRPADSVALLALVGITLGEGAGPSGYDIMHAANQIGWTCSPGTVYPIVNDLLDEGLVTRQQYARTKRYQIDDVDATHDRLVQYEARLQWLLDLTQTARADLETASDEE